MHKRFLRPEGWLHSQEGTRLISAHITKYKIYTVDITVHQQFSALPKNKAAGHAVPAGPTAHLAVVLILSFCPVLVIPFLPCAAGWVQRWIRRRLCSGNEHPLHGYPVPKVGSSKRIHGFSARLKKTATGFPSMSVCYPVSFPNSPLEDASTFLPCL